MASSRKRRPKITGGNKKKNHETRSRPSLVTKKDARSTLVELPDFAPLMHVAV